MGDRILICTDLDRTLIPNGEQPESPGARELFARLCQRPEIALVFVTGRDRELVMEATREYALPLPDHVIGDVGTSIYTVANHQWQSWHSWQVEIADSWRGYDREHLASWLADLSVLQLQEDAKQNIFKLSYYTAATIETGALIKDINRRLLEHNVEASIIWSLDETTNTGLLDILPAKANKRHAIEFVMQTLGFDIRSTLFAGDSGNDLPVLTSPLWSVLVANRTEAVSLQATRMAKEQHTENALYLARGDHFGMNGNYSAGVLEGLVHYFPYTESWIEEVIGA